MKIDVALLPRDVSKADLSNTVCIVLDIFRATSSIVTAMANGCKTIVPVLSIEDARTLAAQIKPVLFAGERQSIKIDGFDFGNSPLEFSVDKVQDNTIIMTTTNGTAAIKSTESAYATLIGSFVNASAVCEKARSYDKDVMIVCAGTEGMFSLEDALCAGFLVSLLEKGNELADAAQGVLLMYQQAQADLLGAGKHSRNGQRLYDIGRQEDAEYCFTIDQLDAVPQYVEGRIILDK